MDPKDEKDPTPPSRMGKETGIIKQKEIEAEVREQEIAAEVKKAEIAANLELGKAKIAAEVNAKKIDAENEDGKRNDRTSFAKVSFAGMAVLMSLFVFGTLAYNAMSTGSLFNFSGFGFTAGVGTTTTTTTTTSTPETPAEPASTITTTITTTDGDTDAK